MAMAELAESDMFTAPFASTTTVVPTHADPLLPPLSRSQYVPAGSPVAIGATGVIDAVPRLMATKPLLPREKAIAFAPSSHQWLTSVPATRRRKPTMATMYGSRCSHTHWPIVAVSRLAAQITLLVLPLASDGGPMSRPADVRSKA